MTGDRVCWLPGRALVGRSSSCVLQIRDKRVSGEHARLEFRGGSWELRDLGSRNGTLVNDQRIEPGQTILLRAGDTVCFGSQGEGWELVSAGAPDAMAISTDEAAEVIRAESGFLAIPEDQTPEVYIYQDAQGDWRAEQGDDAVLVRDQALLSAGGRQWVLHLPESLDATWAPRSESTRQLGDLSLRFAVSSDEEHVAIYVVHPAGEERLPTRAHDYMLLTLARARLRDRAAGISAAEEGWLHVSDLCRMLRVDDNKLGVDIFRARKVLSEQGIQGAADIIERRRTSRQVRIGVDRLSEGAV